MVSWLWRVVGLAVVVLTFSVGYLARDAVDAVTGESNCEKAKKVYERALREPGISDTQLETIYEYVKDCENERLDG